MRTSFEVIQDGGRPHRAHHAKPATRRGSDHADHFDRIRERRSSGRSDRGGVTDIATGWTEVRTVHNKAARHVFCALVEIQAALPFPLLGIDSDYADLRVMPIWAWMALPGRR